MEAPRGSTLTLLLITSTSSLCANSPLDSLSGPLSVTREQAADGGRPLQPGQKPSPGRGVLTDCRCAAGGRSADGRCPRTG
ncbi:MAG: hypothetical protein AB2705_00225 [Candidatus Thiodiazotropha sp.]